jgi:hypothetical protein
MSTTAYVLLRVRDHGEVCKDVAFWAVAPAQFHLQRGNIYLHGSALDMKLVRKFFATYSLHPLFQVYNFIKNIRLFLCAVSTLGVENWISNDYFYIT